MKENRDPIKCKHCGTVNGWNSESCRTCGEKISYNLEDAPNGVSDKEEGENAPEVDEVSVGASSEDDDTALRDSDELSSKTHLPQVKRRWNIFWIMTGIAIHVVVIHIGVFAIIKYFIEPDPELKKQIERTLEVAQSSEAVDEEEFFKNTSDPVKSKLNTIRVFFILLLGLTPMLIGALIGYFTGGILDSAASMGLSAVLIPLLNNAALFAVFWGPLNALFGALGAYLAFRYVKRLSAQNTAAP